MIAKFRWRLAPESTRSSPDKAFAKARKSSYATAFWETFVRVDIFVCAAAQPNIPCRLERPHRAASASSRRWLCGHSLIHKMRGQHGRQIRALSDRRQMWLFAGLFRGDDRNRTGVDGFAGRCVATPPRRRETSLGYRAAAPFWGSRSAASPPTCRQCGALSGASVPVIDLFSLR